MPTDTKLNSLIINYLTEAQYKGTTPNENELYLTPDGGSEIETINGTFNEDGTATLEKAVTKIPTVIQLSMGNIKLIGTVTNAVNVSTEATIYYGMMNAISFYDGTDVPQDATSVYSIQVIGTTATLTKCIMPNDIYDDNLEKDKVLTATKYNNFFTYQWKDYQNIEVIVPTFSGDRTTFTLPKKPSGTAYFLEIGTQKVLMTNSGLEETTYSGFCITDATSGSTQGSFFQSTNTSGTVESFFLVDENTLQQLFNIVINKQNKTFLHSITAKGATLSMSFTYPSTDELPVDSPQDAITVISPTTNEYFASPVVVVATKKISDGYNCIYYNGTSWKFALWDGTSFTDGEAVTDWKDSVVAVD